MRVETILIFTFKMSRPNECRILIIDTDIEANEELLLIDQDTDSVLKFYQSSALTLLICDSTKTISNIVEEINQQYPNKHNLKEDIVEVLSAFYRLNIVE